MHEHDIHRLIAERRVAMDETGRRWLRWAFLGLTLLALLTLAAALATRAADPEPPTGVKRS